MPSTGCWRRSPAVHRAGAARDIDNGVRKATFRHLDGERDRSRRRHSVPKPARVHARSSARECGSRHVGASGSRQKRTFWVRGRLPAGAEAVGIAEVQLVATPQCGGHPHRMSGEDGLGVQQAQLVLKAIAGLLGKVRSPPHCPVSTCTARLTRGLHCAFPSPQFDLPHVSVPGTDGAPGWMGERTWVGASVWARSVSGGV
jgi:hypothetical protein